MYKINNFQKQQKSCEVCLLTNLIVELRSFCIKFRSVGEDTTKFLVHRYWAMMSFINDSGVVQFLKSL